MVNRDRQIAAMVHSVRTVMKTTCFSCFSALIPAEFPLNLTH